MKNSIQTGPLLREAEARQERIAAFWRILVFGALLATVLTATTAGAHYHPLVATVGAYGVLAVIGVWLAWRQTFHPILPYAFITCETGLIAAQVVLLVGILDMPSAMIFAVPVATVIFVVLAHAAMRYRPWLVIYAASLYLVALFFGWLVLEPAVAADRTMGGHSHALVHYQIFPVVILGLTAAILFMTNVGTRRLLEQAVQGRLRVARLSRFFSPAIADQLSSDPDQPLMQGQRRTLAVLFVDIRGFTALAEGMQPDEVSRFLTEYRERVAQTARAHDGVVDKFIGDAVLIFFGLFSDQNEASRQALACTDAALAAMANWAQARAKTGLGHIEVGIGAHLGEVFVGVVGEDELLEFTVIGDTVNVAERLERLTRELDASAVISRDLAQAAGKPLPKPWRKLEDAQVPGRQRTLGILYRPRLSSEIDASDT